MNTQDPIRAELAKAKERLTVAQQHALEAKDDVRACSRQVDHLQKTLAGGARFELKVSDHAMFRYAERVLGFDPAELLRLVQDKVEPVAYLFGDCKVPIAPGFVAVVRDGVVVTIEPA